MNTSRPAASTSVFWLELGRIQITVMILSAFFMGLSTTHAAEAKRTCTAADELKIEKIAANLRDWPSIYDAFRSFAHCDDGAIAEGFSDSVVKTLVLKWNQLSEFAKRGASDTAFRAWVLKHIDATASEGELQRVLSNSESHCQKKNKALCQEITSAAKAALEELRQ